MLVNRRQFLQTGLGTLALAVAPPKAETRIGIALIGLGKQGSQVLQELLWLRESYPIEIICLCDSEASILEEAARWFPQIRQTADYRDALAGVQAAVIATPDSSHAAILQAALQASLDVYLEPPLARNSHEAEGLIQFAKERGSIVQLGIHQVNHAAYTTVRDIVSSGSLGKVSRIEIAVSLKSLPVAHDWQLSKELSDGQATMILTQMVEIVRYIMDVSMPIHVAAQGGVYIQEDGRSNPDTFHALLNYPQGFLLSFSMGLAKSAFNIYGTHGTLDLLKWQLNVHDDLPQTILHEAAAPNTLRTHLADWLSSVQSRTAPRLPIQAGYDQVRLIESILAAYKGV